MNEGEVRRRIVAARILLDISQDEMNIRGAAEGLGKVELGRVERGQKPLQPYHLPMLAQVLEVPISWFTEPREVIVAQAPADPARLVHDLRRLIAELRSTRPLGPSDDLAGDLGPDAPPSPPDEETG